MEVLRDAGLEEAVKPHASSAHHMMHSSWLHSLAGEEYGRLWAWGNNPARLGEYAMASPCEMSDLPQSKLEPVLVQQATNLGAEYRFYTEFISQMSLADGRVETTLRDRKTDQTYKVRSDYLVGADGARSSVLDSLGITVDGKQLNTAFNVHIKADLTKYIAHRPGSLNWILNPEAPDWSAVGNFRMVSPWTEFVVSMHPANKDGRTFEPSDEDILKRLYQMIGDDSVPIEILSSFRWTINDQVARSWQKGNIICIGDAVHRHPPINGLGSNTCISDAMNVAWKLAYVIKGVADPSILSSITAERKPVGDGIVRRANEGMEDQRRWWSFIGLTKDERAAAVSLMEQPTPEGRKQRQNFRSSLEKLDDELNALGIQMNQIYAGSPLVYAEAGDEPPSNDHIDLVKQLAVSTYPGYHLPHVWLAENGQSQKISSLDVCGNGRYTLLTGIGGDAWLDAVSSLQQERPGIVVNVISIGWHQDYMDAYGDWEKVRGVEEEGCVLVRPDHFVAWRCRSMAEDPTARLRDVFEMILPPPGAKSYE
ncbi:hypothetical protein E4T39_03151 [Aureobasidium subglaciale]|nr:hypothetical protein E4T39_03151 [Aureobasidium subglaciale]